MNIDRFEGIVEHYINLFDKLSTMREQELKEVPKDDPYLRGLKRGTSDSFRLAAEWLEETLEKEKERVRERAKA